MDLPQPSPLCTFTQKIGLTDIEVQYSRPGAKGRTVFGEVVPLDKFWRTGANQSTKISFSTDVKLEGQTVPAGKYALFTIPGNGEWTVMISKHLGAWKEYKESTDQVRLRLKTVPLNDPVETFRIELRDLGDETGTLVLEWEKVRVPIKVEVDVVSTVLPEIEKATAPGQTPTAIEYFRYAMFWLNHDQDVNKAAEWVDAGLAQKSDFTWLLMHAKARVLAKKGDKAAALATAKEAKELAIKVEGPGGAFSLLNDKVIASLK